MEQSRNVKLSLLKGIACVGVVLIHIRFPGAFGQLVMRAAGFAVPVFFMVAGYYSYGKGQDTIARRCKKIFRIFVCAYALHFLYCFAEAAADQSLRAWLVSQFNWKTPILYLCFCTIDFAIPLWYLIAMIEVYALWWLTVRRGREETAVKALPLLFALRILLTCYCETKDLPWFWKVNFLTGGMPWFLLGYVLHSPAAESVKQMRVSRLCALVLIGLVISVMPKALMPVRLNVIGSIPCAFGLFVLAQRNPGKSLCKPLEYLGERLSLYVYILHPLIGKAIKSALLALGLDTQNAVYRWIRPIIVLMTSIALSWIVDICAERTRKRAA